MSVVTTTVLWPFFQDHPGEPVPEQKLLDFMVQGKINRGRHTDHPAGRHSIWTNQCAPPPAVSGFQTVGEEQLKARSSKLVLVVSSPTYLLVHVHVCVVL